jgi:hypothetical protein
MVKVKKVNIAVTYYRGIVSHRSVFLILPVQSSPILLSINLIVKKNFFSLLVLFW